MGANCGATHFKTDRKDCAEKRGVAYHHQFCPTQARTQLFQRPNIGIDRSEIWERLCEIHRGALRALAYPMIYSLW